MQQIRGNVFAETKEPGCNPGAVVTTEGIVFIDSPQQPSYALNLQEEMKQRGEFRYLINTEPHNDHVIGNYFFPIPVIAHQKTREALEKISFFDRYPIDVGLTEAKSREVQRMNVNHLYDVLNKK